MFNETAEMDFSPPIGKLLTDVAIVGNQLISRSGGAKTKDALM